MIYCFQAYRTVNVNTVKVVMTCCCQTQTVMIALCQKSQYNSKLQHVIAYQKSITGHSCQMSKISGQIQISGQCQDTFKISGISGQLGPLRSYTMLHEHDLVTYCNPTWFGSLWSPDIYGIRLVINMLWVRLPAVGLVLGWVTTCGRKNHPNM